MSVSVVERRKQIEDALDYAGGTYTFEDVRLEVADAKRQFWPGPNSAIVTGIIDYPRRRVLEFFLAGGDMKELEAMVPGICEWGRAQGCVSASFAGRKGWARTFLTKSGWLPSLVVFEKSLDGEVT